MKPLLHFPFWLAQPAAAILIGLGLLAIAFGRWALCKEAELRR